MAVHCPNCHSRLNRVTNTYSRQLTSRGKTYEVIRRRRQCEHCKTYWTTIEKNEEDILKEEVQDAKPPTLSVPLNPYLGGLEQLKPEPQNLPPEKGPRRKPVRRPPLDTP